MRLKHEAFTKFYRTRFSFSRRKAFKDVIKFVQAFANFFKSAAHDSISFTLRYFWMGQALQALEKFGSVSSVPDPIFVYLLVRKKPNYMRSKPHIEALR